ncbi:hypothetical protein MBLNU230_g2036t1 [Neophaeotheca triangularis]
MASSTTGSASGDRPKTLHTSLSFSKMQDPPQSPSRHRASTTSGITPVPAAKYTPSSLEIAGEQSKGDVFETHEEDEGDEATEDADSTNSPAIKLPSTIDELPIEIRSLTERFLERLSAKVHQAPLNADALSELFQDFYVRAEQQIETHIATLSSRIGREKTPSKAPPKSSAQKRAGSTRGDSPSSTTSGGEMLTPSEVADRRKARRLLDLKRVALEEAVERAVCEKVYSRTFKHRSTEDDARDEKLRSRTAALAVVGIGLKELHMDADPAKDDVRKTTQEKENEINQSLGGAREALQKMDEYQFPLGKLQCLTAAHKSVVETLSELFPSSSSADEVLPTLIYTLITSPPEGINVVSNLNFIQRFRTQSKVDGEAAYCLVNLEAAISFLETVDLASLRADELPEGPPKSNSRPSTPTSTEKPQSISSQPIATKALSPDVSVITATSQDTSSATGPASKSLPIAQPARPTLQQHRRISSLVQAQADRIEAGRENFLKTADSAFDTINGALENSFKSVFGRFKDQTSGASPLPKTLEDARRLVSAPETPVEDEDVVSTSGRSSPGIDDPLSSSASKSGSGNEGKVLELIGGRGKQRPREKSVDSTRSTGSGKKVAFIANNGNATNGASNPKANTAGNSNKSGEEGSLAGNFINNLNPLNRFGVPSFPRFGRAASASASTPTTPLTAASNSTSKQLGNIVESPRGTVNENPDGMFPPFVEKTQRSDSTVSVGAGDEDSMNAAESLAELRRIRPPRKRFLEVRDAGELKLSEVEELLGEYRRLAKAIGEAVAE